MNLTDEELVKWMYYVRNNLANVPERDRDDVAQEAMLGLIRALPSFRGECSMKTWVHSILKRKKADAMRRVHRQEKKDFLLRHALARKGPYIPRTHFYESPCINRMTVEFVLAGLPKKYSELLHDFYIRGMKYAEIAEAHGVSYECIRSRHRRALEYARRLFN